MSDAGRLVPHQLSAGEIEPGLKRRPFTIPSKLYLPLRRLCLQVEIDPETVVKVTIEAVLGGG